MREERGEARESICLVRKARVRGCGRKGGREGDSGYSTGKTRTNSNWIKDGENGEYELSLGGVT